MTHSLLHSEHDPSSPRRDDLVHPGSGRCLQHAQQPAGFLNEQRYPAHHLGGSHAILCCGCLRGASVIPATGQAPVAVESNPPGDIPDNLAFVAYRDPGSRFRFTHPEGWAEQTTSSGVIFSEKLNGVEVDSAPHPSSTQVAVPTVAGAHKHDVPALAAGEPAFALTSVSAVSTPGGRGVLIVYQRNSAADPVTGREYRDEVRRYDLVSAGREVVMELFGPVGADNVDADATMVNSLRLA